MKVELEIDLDRYLREYSVDDEYPVPVTLESLVVSHAVRDVAEKAMADRGWHTSVRERVAKLRDEEIREQLQPIIADAVAAGVRRTNAYGEPMGEPVTLREVIVDEAKKQLQATTDRNGYGGTKHDTVLAALIKHEVQQTLRAELATELEAAKAEVKAAVREQAATVLQDTITRLAGVR